ncbi:hypothetical protein PRNP1_006980 [Phytophthora ramorum]
MNMATIIRAGVLGSALAATLTQGYTFTENGDVSTNSATEEASTGLTTNEENRIFGGSEADASQFPYIVSLREDGADESTYCGGTLIASQYVVTAAHCVKTDEATIYASIGSAFGSGSGGGEQLKVIEGYKHPMYNKSEHLYDIGVLKLEKEVSVSTIDLCAADGSDNQVGTVATVRGWGLTENGSESLMLKEVNVQIVSNAECNKEYSDRITEGMLCAGDGNGRDSCNGDSGGPLIANDVLVGIVSWGGKCGVNAGVYTRVSYVLDYINDVTSGGTGSSFAENAAGSTDQGQDNSSESTSTDGTETPATTTPSTEAPATKVPTAVPMTEAPTVAPTTETPTPAPTTVSPTEMPETESPSTNQADQYDPDTESPETESASEADQYEPATDSAEQSEPSVNSAEHSESPVDSAEQNYPAEIEAPTPASGKECATQF